jgi:hypothetical protein
MRRSEADGQQQRQGLPTRGVDDIAVEYLLYRDLLDAWTPYDVKISR